MITHPDSYTAIAFMRHEELLAEGLRERKAKAASQPARPGAPRGLRTWLGSILICLGAWLQAKPGEQTPARIVADRWPPAIA